MLLSLLYATGPVGFVLIVIMGSIAGYFLKRVILVVLSVLIGLDTIPMAIGMLRAGEIATLLAIVLGVAMFAALLPMWITHFVKRAGGVKSCLTWLKDKTLDVGKKPE